MIYYSICYWMKKLLSLFLSCNIIFQFWEKAVRKNLYLKRLTLFVWCTSKITSINTFWEEKLYLSFLVLYITSSLTEKCNYIYIQYVIGLYKHFYENICCNRNWRKCFKSAKILESLFILLWWSFTYIIKTMHYQQHKHNAIKWHLERQKR